MAPTLVITALFLGSIGLMLFVIGAIFTAVVALGNNQKLYGWLIFFIMPIAIIYCSRHWDKAAYSGKMVFSGTVLLLITAMILKIGGVL